MGTRIFVDTVGRNKERIREYIKNQLEEDKIADQMSMRVSPSPKNGHKTG